MTRQSVHEYHPFLLADFYKLSHRAQFPPGTEYVYETWTPRATRIDGVTEVVAFGFQAFIQRYLNDYFSEHFFLRSKNAVLDEYTRIVRNTLGVDHPDTRHLAHLHDLGYLPLHIKAVPEGTRVPLRVPMLTIENTDPACFWLPGALETLMSLSIWQPSTSATIADRFRQLFDRWATKTAGSTAGVEFQGHDFSMRGMESVDAAAASGAGHLLSFVGTDTIPAILYAERFYGANVTEELVGTSIPATEHSVMCAYGKGGEVDAYRRLITEVYPAGLVSIVSDTWDLWAVLRSFGAELRDAILGRDGKVVVRPDSGNPVDIICGDPNTKRRNPESKGVVEILWDTFGGTTTDEGYRVLDSHVGVIYGDAITYERADLICERLAVKGFASTNVVFGIGSFCYQYQTRDTFNFALKATYCEIAGEPVDIFKDPVTDIGHIKKSLTGRVVVIPDAKGDLQAVDHLSRHEQDQYADIDVLEDVYVDGFTTRTERFADIRARLGHIT